MAHFRRSAPQPRSPWATVVHQGLEGLGGQGSLQALYAEIARQLPGVPSATWRATVRRTLQEHTKFERVARGVWRLAGTR